MWDNFPFKKDWLYPFIFFKPINLYREFGLAVHKPAHKSLYDTTCPQSLEKIFVNFFTIRQTCQKYDKDFFKFCGFLRKPKL